MPEPTYRTVTLSRADNGTFTARNVRGGTLAIADGEASDFTPTELLLSAIGSCTALDVDTLVTRRAEPTAFEVKVEADKIRDESGNRLENIVVTFQVSFPAGADGDAAREVLPEAVERSHDWICTVGRTVEIGTPISTLID
jgi:putative redox protein